MGLGPNLGSGPASSLKKERRSRDRAPVRAAALFYSDCMCLLRRVRSEGSRNKSSGSGDKIRGEIRNEKFFCYRPLCAYTTYIHSHIQYKIKLALCTGWAKEKPHLLNDLAWDNNFFLKNYTTYPIILSPMFFTQQTVQKNEVWFGSLCSLHRRLYSRVVITTLPQSSKSN